MQFYFERVDVIRMRFDNSAVTDREPRNNKSNYYHIDLQECKWQIIRLRFR